MKQSLFLKRLVDFKSVRTLLNRQGQAVVEYVLLMIVTISLLLAFKGVISSMDSFMSDFMGEYVVCLMEYGELPSLGVQEADLKNHENGTGKKCEFRKFSASQAANLANKNSSSLNGSNTDNEKNATSSADKNSKNENSKSDSESGSSGAKSASRKSSSYANGQISRAGSAGTVEAPKADNKIKVIEEDEEPGFAQRQRGPIRSRQSQTRYGQNSYKSVSGKLAAEIEKKSKPYPRRPSSKTLLASEEGYRFLPYKKTFNPPKTNSAYQAAKDDDFTIGNFMKWLVISGILIACFILFGGQVLNYTNSNEK